MDVIQNLSQEAPSSNEHKDKRRKVQYCDLEGQDDIICDYKINNASIVSDKVTIPDINKHLNLVGKALSQKKERILFQKAPGQLINYFKLLETAMMCHHCLYKTDNDPEYLDSPNYQSPAQKKSNEKIQKFQNKTYALRDDIFYSEEEFQQLESAYHEVCAELEKAKLEPDEFNKC
nr:5925_t:CDS:2 [Entrophospora candida]